MDYNVPIKAPADRWKGRCMGLPLPKATSTGHMRYAENMSMEQTSPPVDEGPYLGLIGSLLELWV